MKHAFAAQSFVPCVTGVTGGCKGGPAGRRLTANTPNTGTEMEPDAKRVEWEQWLSNIYSYNTFIRALSKPT